MQQNNPPNNITMLHYKNINKQNNTQNVTECH